MARVRDGGRLHLCGGGHPGKCRGHCNGWFSVCFLAALGLHCYVRVFSSCGD